MLRRFLSRAGRAFRRRPSAVRARREVEDPLVEPGDDRRDEHESAGTSPAGRRPSKRLPVDAATPNPD